MERVESIQKKNKLLCEEVNFFQEGTQQGGAVENL